MNEWNISQAKSKFTQMVISSEEAPQIICNRGKPVGAMIHIDLFNELMALREKERKPTIAEMLEELKIIRESEPVEIDIPERRDRPNPFEETADEMAL